MLMMRGAPSLLISDEQGQELEASAGSPSLSHRTVRQAEGLVLAADGIPNEETGRRVGVSANTVRAWRASFARLGVGGVGVIAAGRGRKPWLPEGTVAEVVRVTLNEQPDDTSTHWTTSRWPPGSGSGRTRSPRSGVTTS